MDPAGNVFQGKIGEIFKELPNVFGNVDGILIVGYGDEGRDYDRTIRQVMKICHKQHLKLNINKCNFMCMSVPFFGKIMFRQCA